MKSLPDSDREGEQGVWDALYKKHHMELLRYCTSVCGNMQTAEDLAQEVFLKAMQNADVFEDLGPSQQRAWLFRTMKNLICDGARRAAVEARYVEIYPDDTVAPETGYSQTENALLLAALPEPDRTLFRMRYVDGYTAAELAEIFGLQPGTVRSKLSRSRAILRLLLDGTGK